MWHFSELVKDKVVDKCASFRPWESHRVLKFGRWDILAMKNSIMKFTALSKVARVRLEYYRYLI